MRRTLSLRRLLNAAMVFAFLLTASLSAPTHGAPLVQSAARHASQEAEAPNAMCPVTADEPIDPNFSTIYEGREVFFCCRRCRSKFEADPDAYLSNLPAMSMVSVSQATQAEEEHNASNEHTQDSVQDDAHEPEADEDHQPTAEPEAGEHEHNHGAVGGFEFLPYLGRFHVLVIHFPIVLLVLAGVIEVFDWIRPTPGASMLTRLLIGLGAASALVAMLLGMANAIGTSYSGTLSWVFWWHRALGITTAVLATGGWIAVEVRNKRRTTRTNIFARTLVLLAAVFVAVTGHFGGALVFGWDYLAP